MLYDEMALIKKDIQLILDEHDFKEIEHYLQQFMNEFQTYDLELNVFLTQ